MTALPVDGRVWHVRDYPSGEILHTAGTYEAADRWRVENEAAAVIVPEWPGDL